MNRSGKRSYVDVDIGEAQYAENDTSTSKKHKGQSVGEAKSQDENLVWELSTGKQPRRVEITEFRGAKLINIREFYHKDGKLLPGKKGISLNTDQYQAFVMAVPSINARLAEQGVIIENFAMEDPDDAQTNPKSKVNEKDKTTAKASIDTTSDKEGDEE